MFQEFPQPIRIGLIASRMELAEKALQSIAEANRDQVFGYHRGKRTVFMKDGTVIRAITPDPSQVKTSRVDQVMVIASDPGSWDRNEAAKYLLSNSCLPEEFKLLILEG